MESNLIGQLHGAIWKRTGLGTLNQTTHWRLAYQYIRHTALKNNLTKVIAQRNASNNQIGLLQNDINTF